MSGARRAHPGGGHTTRRGPPQPGTRGGGLDQLGDLGGGGDGAFGGPLGAGARDLARVPDDRTVLDGHIEDSADESVGLADRGAPTRSLEGLGVPSADQRRVKSGSVVSDGDPSGSFG